jgi:hypothetical protein
MEERDEAEDSEGDRLPLFYTSGDKQIEYPSFTEAKAIERVHCPICLDAHSAGSLDWREPRMPRMRLFFLNSVGRGVARRRRRRRRKKIVSF